MASRTYGDANENGNNDNNNGNNLIDYYDTRQQSININNRCSTTRRSTRQQLSAGNNQPHHGFVFKAFTRDSLIDIKKRKCSKATKKNSAQPAFIQAQQQLEQQAPKLKLEPDPYLASGQQLPPALARQLPPELIGRPIEDIDPYYADQEVSSFRLHFEFLNFKFSDIFSDNNIFVIISPDFCDYKQR